MSEKMKQQLEQLAEIAAQFPDAEAAEKAMARATDFLAGAQAVAAKKEQ